MFYLFIYLFFHEREIADKVGAISGYYTVLPDFFHGEPFVPDRPNRPFQEWFRDHTPVSFYFNLFIFL